jgi:sortase A
MRKIISLLLIAAILAVPAYSAIAADTTSAVAGAAQADFGTNTSVEHVDVYGAYPDNIDRSKNSQLLPPPFGSAEYNYPANTSRFLTPALAAQSAPAIIPPDVYASGQSGGYDLFSGTGSATSSTTNPGSDTKYTAPQYYADGSVGTLYIASTNTTIAVFEGVTGATGEANMRSGAGHFAETSAWDGNVSIAGHNRGNWAHFSFIKDTIVGDRFTYTTMYGSRTYEAYSVTQISVTDTTILAESSENILTLITCVANVPELRFCVRARAVA